MILWLREIRTIACFYKYEQQLYYYLSKLNTQVIGFTFFNNLLCLYNQPDHGSRFASNDLIGKGGSFVALRAGLAGRMQRKPD